MIENIIKTIDYILYKIIEFFNRRYIGIVWVIAFWLTNKILLQYEVEYEQKIYWYDKFFTIFYLLTYLRARWIVIKLDNLDQKKNK